MAEYRRFVAYVYEYQKGKKGSNCGFIKVEAWERTCRMEVHLKCPGLLKGMECTVYGFVRRKGLLDGSRIGSCRTGEGRMDCVLETQTRAVGTGKIPLAEINGMVLILDSGGFFGTEWDDQPIRPEDFREIPAITENKKTELEDGSRENKEKETSENKPQEIQQNTGKKTEEALPVETANAEEKPAQNEILSKPEVHTQSVPESETAEYPNRPLPPPPPGHSSHMQKTNRTVPPKSFGTPCDPFNDGELTECRKITPDELCHFGRRACMLRNNRFLQYGYYNFGHLLLCRNHCGQWILGVPGGYDQQERFMANMFGFSYFKESKTIRIPKGKGGYWYRLIDAPNSNQ